MLRDESLDRQLDCGRAGIVEVLRRIEMRARMAEQTQQRCVRGAAGGNRQEWFRPAASVLTLANRLQRFVNKHESSINQLLRLATQEGTPKTTNSLESKNGLFKPFSPIAKFFPRVATCQVFFAGVVLMENSDVKTRGIHRGTSALQRAGINLEDLGAADFFGAVGLPKPQISLPALTG